MSLDQETRAGIDRQFRLAIQVLALPAEEQIRVTEPGCVTCELLIDFRNWYEAYHAERSRDWSQKQVDALRALADALDAIPDEGFECGNKKSLDHPGWDEVRRLAKEALEAFSWPMETPPPFEEVKPGMWARPGEHKSTTPVFDNDPLHDRLTRISRKLEKLMNVDFLGRVFGARSHWYRMRPPLSSAQLDEFERRNRVSLPQEYARFITTIGNAGAGPHYGLLPLDPSSVDESLARPFPHTAAWNFPEELFARWGREEEERYNSEEYRFGTVPIAHEGCGIMHLLVVTGPERGNVWCDDRANDGGIYPLVRVKPGQAKCPGILYGAAEEERCSFLDWYEHWLDAGLARPRSHAERILGSIRSTVRKIRRADIPSRRLKQ